MTPPAQAAKPRPKVLLIDDELPLLDALSLGLKNDFEVEIASSAEEAALLETTRQYDVVVCDQMLPGEQGLEFLIRSSERQPGARRIMMTGYINPELLSRSVSLAKLSACLIKPVGAKDLTQAIRAALR
jgi:DNA-binding NtrC family response regulator